MPRPRISDRTVDALMAEFRRVLNDQIAEKGRGGWVSSHETLGAVSEEFDEFKEAVHAGSRPHIDGELMDIMIAAFWGLASDAEGGWDW